MGLEGKKSNFTRRALLAGGGAALLGYIAGADRSGTPNKEASKNDKKNLEVSPENALDFLKVEPRPKLVTLGRLADRKVTRKVADKQIERPLSLGGDLEMMLGFTQAERQVQVDPRMQLSVQWRKKLGQVFSKLNRYPPEQLAVIRKLFLSYNPDKANETTLEKYRLSIQAAISGVRAALDLNSLKKLEQFKGLDRDQLMLVKDLAGSITADTMLSYILTELMPSAGSDNQLGLDVLDDLLRHYGRDYVNLIPALHDPNPKLISFGEYQITHGVVQEKYRIGEGGASEEDFHGASVINKLFSTRKIPADVTDLRGDQHHVAAYLFAIYNIALGVRSLGPLKSKELRAAGEFIPAGFAEEFLAAAHHRPADAIAALKKYTDAVTTYKKVPEADRSTLPEPDYAVAAKAVDNEHGQLNKKVGKKVRPVDMHAYVMKTRANRLAVSNRFGSIRERSL